MSPLGNLWIRSSPHETRKKMRILNTLFIALIAFTLGSCSTDHSHNESSEKSQAVAIHDGCTVVSREFHKKLANQFAQTAQTDSAFIHLVDLDRRFVKWKKTLVKLPGTECNHAEGEEHVHNHVAEAALEKLSDAELLELQKAIRSELDSIICDFNKLIGEDC